jgi:hypothetical protein
VHGLQQECRDGQVANFLVLEFPENLRKPKKSGKFAENLRKICGKFAQT